MYIGTYTRGDSKGIYSYRFDPASGKLTEVGVAAEMGNPSFLYLTPNGKRVYAVGEASSGIVAAFDASGDGKLTKINEKESGGNGPCHIVADKAGKVVLVAHYGSGSVAAFKIDSKGGIGDRTALVQHEGSSVDQNRQSGPHAHSVTLSKSEKFVVVGDLGLDQYVVYALDANKGTLTKHSAAKTKPGGGPRHFSFAPDFKHAYGVLEMGGEMTAFVWDEGKGELKEIQTLSTLPADYSGPKSCAEVLVHPTGRFVYSSNRGHDSIAHFVVEAGGKLSFEGTTPSGGKTPRNFRIHPSGNWLIAANQDGGNLVVFKIDKSTGKLTPSGEQAKVPFPVCIKFA